MTDTLIPPAAIGHAPSTGRFTAITSEGGLLPLDLLDEVASGEAPHQAATDFGVEGRLPDEIQNAFADARAFWDAFGRRRARSGVNLTTLTREAWVGPLLERLGYEELITAPAPADGETFAISHRAGADEHAPPVHIVSFDQELDVRGSHRRRTPHASVQELLNRTDAVWGVATNGRQLRLLRDSAKLVKPSYLEFDLQGMIESNLYSEFAVFYRLLHRSRLPRGSADAATSPLEQLYQGAQERGGRVREKLRDGVEAAIEALGTGFLRDHAGSAELRSTLADGSLTQQAYYRELLRLVYRLLFLMVAEERRLVADPGGAKGAYERYASYFAVTRVRDLSEQPTLRTPAQAAHADLWPGLVQTFKFFGDSTAARLGGVTHLNGDLFAPTACPHLEAGAIPNGDLLLAISHLNRYKDEGEGAVRGRGRRLRRGGAAVWRRVNYAALDVEELGSVYESLLDLQPSVDLEASPPSFGFVKSNERKSSGSYYTPPGLVGELVKSALDPVIVARLAAFGPGASIADREAVLLDIKVCDPAAGSGHFLLAAARRLGRELARVRSEGGEPGADSYRAATRDVIAHCIYGVDLNPLAVELCKVALWLEAHEPGKPLGFLDHRIRHGNSLIGAPPGFDPSTVVIPDDAYKKATGDDDDVVKATRAKNKAERRRYEVVGKGQLTMISDGTTWSVQPQYVATMNRTEQSVEDVAAKQAAYQRHRADASWYSRRLPADLWTAAYFWPMTPTGGQAPTTADIRASANEQSLWYSVAGHDDGSPELQSFHTRIATSGRIAEEVSAFHWDVEFEDVFGRDDPGFDCILGNPPWDQVQLDPGEFFSTRDKTVADAPHMAARMRAIKMLATSNPALHTEYLHAVRVVEGFQGYAHESDRFPLSSRGRLNTAPLFTEAANRLVRGAGRAGLIVPSGIATDSFTQHFFNWMVKSGRLATLYDFENREGIFPGVHRSYKFCLLTTAGGDRPAAPFDVAFFLTQPEQINDPERRFTLSADEIALLNPNTGTSPVFRSSRDAELTKRLYRIAPVLIRESNVPGTVNDNPWNVTFKIMFMMNTTSSKFKTLIQLENEGLKITAGHRFIGDSESYVPLYEAKMIHQFDHRFATYQRSGQSDGTHDVSLEEHRDPNFLPLPRYWIPESEILPPINNLPRKTQGWFLSFRGVTRNTDRRTAIFTAAPLTAIADPMMLMATSFDGVMQSSLLANVNSFVFDFLARQKFSGAHLTFFILKQLPIIPPEQYTSTLIDQIGARVLELSYTAWDLEPFAKDCGYDGPPFSWDEARRLQLRSELDGIYAHLYGLSRDDFAYILDTFPIVRRHDEAKHGEFVTKRLCLEAYDWFDPGTIQQLDVRVKRVEVALRSLIVQQLGPGVSRIPFSRLDKLRVEQAKQAKGEVSVAARDSLTALLEASYLVDLKALVAMAENWPLFEARFRSKKDFENAVQRVSDIRNPLAHVRTLDDETRKRGEQAVAWLEERLT